MSWEQITMLVTVGWWAPWVIGLGVLALALVLFVAAGLLDMAIAAMEGVGGWLRR